MRVPALVLAPGALMSPAARVAHAVIRGGERFRITAVVDPDCEGEDAGTLIDHKHRGVPVVASIDEAIDEAPATPEYCIIGMETDDIVNAEPLPTTKVCWYAWEGLMANRHWLLGLIGNTCAERANIPGYGPAGLREHGWFGMERQRWQKLFGLKDEELVFFSGHEEADIIHSDMGWKTVAERAEGLHMADDVVQACYDNLLVWEIYLNGIGDGADKEG